MAGNTGAPWSLPYPTGTDRVADGDNAIQALADRVDVVLDRELIRTAINGLLCPPVNSWTAGVFVSMRAGWCEVALIDANKDAWGANETIATVPSGYRPAQVVVSAGVVKNTGALAFVYVFPDGRVVSAFGAAAGSGGIGASLVYPLFTSSQTLPAPGQPDPDTPQPKNDETEGNDQ